MSNNQVISIPVGVERNSTGSVSSGSAEANTQSSSSLKSSELRLVEQASAPNKNVKKSSFSSAIKALAPGRIFRCVVGLYADRKLFILASFHIAATLICYAHFGLMKFQSQSTTVPAAAPFRNWKVGVPTFEFGTMHAILFQLAILPLTMCRLLIASLSKTAISKIIPFNDMTRCHIAIGYTFAFLLLVAIVVFLIFFGTICNAGDQSFCKKFSTEIMITGYFIFITFMTVAFTSFFRYKIKYRIFYVVHHIVFIAYILTIMHTIDVVERKQGGRSQTYKWFASSILLYLADRASMYLSHRYDSRITSAFTIDSEDKTGRLVILKVKKPSMLTFEAGQYVYLKIPKVDNRWHPFSIASSPDNDVMSFYIKVYGEKSWSNNLYDVLQAEIESRAELDMKIEVLGPYGTALGDKRDYTHATVVGTGTGFVPCMSALEDHVNSCLTLDPQRYVKKSVKRRSIAKESLTWKRPANSFLKWGDGHGSQDVDMLTAAADLIQQAGKTKRKIYTHVLFLIAPALGVLALGLTYSWNFYGFALYEHMETVLMSITMVFQATFLASMVLIGEDKIYLKIVDLVFIVLNAVSDWYWISKNLFGNFRQFDLIMYSLLSVYMILRLWSRSLCDIDCLNSQHSAIRSGPVVYEKFHFVWSCRSAELIAQVFPDLSSLWDELVKSWGQEEATKRCEIKIHCTDLDRERCQKLVNAIQDSNLYKHDCLKFGKPFLLGILEETSMEILSSDLLATQTLFAFCGSEVIAKELKAAKVLKDLVLSMTGHVSHTTDLVIQTYGSTPSGSTMGREDRFLEPPAPHPFNVRPATNDDVIDLSNDDRGKTRLARLNSAFSRSNSKMEVDKNATYIADDASSHGSHVSFDDSYISSEDDDIEMGEETDIVLQSPPSTYEVFDDDGVAETSEVPMNIENKNVYYDLGANLVNSKIPPRPKQSKINSKRKMKKSSSEKKSIKCLNVETTEQSNNNPQESIAQPEEEC